MSKYTIANILEHLEIESLNAMQKAAQNSILGNADTLLLSPTGSGKTLAFLLPVFQLLQTDVKTVQCMVIAPSRELALQIEQVWKTMKTGFKVNTCYGGHSIDVEINNLSSPPALLIGTPGRIADHLERNTFSTKTIRLLILDEFDKSLQLGFHEEMSYIIEELDNIQKRILVSATSDIDIPDYTGVISPSILDFSDDKEKTVDLTLKQVISDEKDKVDCLFALLCNLDSEPALIFANHREVTERVSNLLNEMGIYSGYYHGGMDQDDRERVLIQFRNGSITYLITTDLAARGLDIREMKHVIHYHLPSKETEFTHRNGRTARMLASGTAYVITYKDDFLPDYIDPAIEILDVPRPEKLPNPPAYKTVYISGGKKNKINKIDIVGFFSQKGNLQKEDIGLIEVKDFMSFAAIKAEKVKQLLENIEGEKMKGKKYKIEVARDVLKPE